MAGTADQNAAEPGKIQEVENVPDALQCVICLGLVCDAHLCPHCSKLGCFACFEKWFVSERNGQCPHCRADIELKEFVKCRWLKEFTTEYFNNVTALEEMKQLLKKKSRSTEADDRCRRHSEGISVYCSDCEISICQQTALWSLDHKGHSFKPVEDAYQEQTLQTVREVAKMRKRMYDIKTEIELLQLNMDALKLEKEEFVKNLIIPRLDSILKSSIDPIKKHQALLSKELKDIETAIDLVNAEQDSCSHVAFTSKYSRLLRKMQSFTDKPMASLKMEPVVVNFTKELFDDECSTWFVLEDFTEQKRLGSSVHSKKVFLLGMGFELVVHPNGEGQAKGEYLSAYIVATGGTQTRHMKFECRIEMIRNKPKPDVPNNYVMQFRADFSTRLNLGYPSFYRLDALIEDEWVDEETDSLIFFFKVKHVG